jgi:hypothetical protein
VRTGDPASAMGALTPLAGTVAVIRGFRRKNEVVSRAETERVRCVSAGAGGLVRPATPAQRLERASRRALSDGRRTRNPRQSRRYIDVNSPLSRRGAGCKS